MVTALFSTSSQAQDTANAKWAKTVIDQPLVFSNDGSTLLTSDGKSVQAWNTTTSKLIAIAGLTPTSYAPSTTNDGFYYGDDASPSKTYFYSFATRTTTLIRTDAAGYTGAYNIAFSANGAKLAIKTFHAISSRYYIVVFNSTTGAQFARIPLPVADSLVLRQRVWVSVASLVPSHMVIRLFRSLGR